MSFFAFTINLRDQQAVERYRAYHRDVWPEVGGPDGALAEIGVEKMRIFLMPPRTLFMYVEAVPGFDPLRDFSRALDLDPRVREWDDIMHNQLLERLEENKGELNWAVMENVFDFAPGGAA